MNFPERMRKRRERGNKLASETPPGERIGLIPYGHPPTEFEVQAFLYSQLLSLGFVVRGEVASKCTTCIFDLVVYSGMVPVRIIEVKKCKAVGCTRKNRRAVARERAKQIERYSSFGVPVDAVCNLREARDYIDAVKANPTWIK